MHKKLQKYHVQYTGDLQCIVNVCIYFK